MAGKPWGGAASCVERGPALEQAQGMAAAALARATECAPQDTATAPKEKERARYVAATDRLLDRVEEELLSFWLISGGGGKEGDRQVAVWFAEHPAGLTAEDLGARVREMFHINLDPGQMTALVHRMRRDRARRIEVHF